MRRREFLQNSLIGTGGWLTGLEMASTRHADKLRIGVIGTGSRGSGLVRVMQSLPQFEVAALCDVLPFRLQQTVPFATPGVRTFMDYRRMLEFRDIDAVIISTPLSMHYAMAADALDAGKHVYCEKTMAYEIEDSLKLVRMVANRAAQVFQTGYQYRYLPLYHKVAEYIRNGSIGQVTNIYVQWNRNGDWRRPVPRPELERLVNWRMYREYSGGLTAELHSHQLEYINWIFDAHPVQVTGFGGIDYWKDGRETFDNVNSLFLYPNGMKVNCIALTANARNDYLIEFRGSRGTIRLSYDKAWWYWEHPNARERGMADGVSGATMPAISLERGEEIQLENLNEGWEGTHYALQSFYDCIIRRETPLANVRNGARAAITVRMAIDAMRNQRIEYWKDNYNT